MDIMRKIAPVGNVYQAGTLSGNPIAVAAGLAMLRYITQHPEIYDQLEQRGQQLTGALVKNPPPGVTVNRVGAMFTMFFTKGPVTDWESAKVADTQRFARFFQFMLERGVYLPPSQFEAAFLSTVMTEADIAKTVGAVREFFAQ